MIGPRSLRRALIGAIACAALPAAADRIAVKVIDVAGTTAYVTPGRAAGLVAGSKVRLHGHTYVVSDSTDKTAAISLGRSVLAVGETGSANVEPAGGATATGKLPPPRPLAAFKDQWPAAELPAASQQVRPVPLGGTGGTGRVHLAVYGHLAGNLDKEGSGGQAEARIVTSFQLMHDRPLGADLDGSVRLFGDGWDTGSRAPLFVRAAQIRYGDPADPSLLAGRLRYAATSLGMLDGARAAVHTGGFEFAAFGGLVPDPVSGAPDTRATRFGGEVIYDRASSAWHPHVAASIHGSTWQGQLDERRLSIAASAHRGSTWLDGWLEAQQFSSDNPWGSPAIDVTGAGLSGEWRRRGRHLGIDVTFLRPERSLRLAATLPDDWLCAHQTKPGDTDEPCLGQDFWAAATVSAGASGSWWSLDAVGSLGQSQGIAIGGDASGYVRGELGRRHRLVLAASGGRSLFAAWMAADVGVATSPSPRLDASLTYRPERLDYQAALGAYFMQSLVADLRWAVTSRLDLALSAAGTTGADREVLALLATVAWRPL